MWKVTNKVNKTILGDFRDKLIEPLLQEIIHYKKQCIKISFIEYIENGIDLKCDSSRDLISYLNKRKTKKIKFGELIGEIASKNSLKKIQQIYKLFLFQNSQIDKCNYNIKEEKISEEVTFLFVNFFYEKFFNYEKIWMLIDKKKYAKINFSREVFHINFKNENNIEVCPYCDIDTTINISNNEIEHFLPKSKFPLLSMNAYNLISSCNGCNKKPDGKGTDVNLPIYAPYNIQIGDNLKFNNDIIRRKIELNTDNIMIENYIKLLNLKSRYSSNRIYDIVEEKAESIYDTISDIEQMINENLTKEAIIAYIDKSCTKFAKREPLSFAIKYTFNKYDLYLQYRKSKFVK